MEIEIQYRLLLHIMIDIGWWIFNQFLSPFIIVIALLSTSKFITFSDDQWAFVQFVLFHMKNSLLRNERRVLDFTRAFLLYSHFVWVLFYFSTVYTRFTESLLIKQQRHTQSSFVSTDNSITQKKVVFSSQSHFNNAIKNENERVEGTEEWHRNCETFRRLIRYANRKIAELKRILDYSCSSELMNVLKKQMRYCSHLWHHFAETTTSFT